jgi:hypothetical protein
MFILPFIHREHTFQLFLTKGGTALISTTCEPSLFCQENEIPIKRIFTKGGIHFVEVDVGKIEPNTFYSFHEENTQELDVWRTFIHIKNDIWSINTSLQSISLSGHTVSSLVEAVLRNSTNI